jgi:beta-lactamase class A
MVLCVITVRCQHRVDGTEALRDTIRSIASHALGTVGVAFQIGGDTAYTGINTARHLPMQSVYKFHLALYFLHQVDRKKLAIDQRIAVDTADWEPKEYSPLRDGYKTPPISIPLLELLRAIIINSDNVACDILFRKAGGPTSVNDYIKSLGITDIAISATEAQMHHSWPVQYSNWTTAGAMVTLLERFDAGKILSPASTLLLRQWMSESRRISGRLKGLLPAGTPVAHKPGTSDVSPQGIAAATNDVGIMTLPDNRHLIVAVFVSDSKAGEASREQVIASIAQEIYRFYTVGKR